MRVPRFLAVTGLHYRALRYDMFFIIETQTLRVRTPPHLVYISWGYNTVGLTNTPVPTDQYRDFIT